MRSLVPTFAPPGEAPPGEPTPTRTTSSSTPTGHLEPTGSLLHPLEQEGTAGNLDEAPEPPGPARRAIRTATSSAAGDDRPKVKPEVAGRLAATVVGGLALVLGYLVAMRRGVRLRQPTDAELKAVGDPLGRIAARHVPVAVINEDLLDAADAADAIGRYVKAGPLIEQDYADTTPDPEGDPYAPGPY